MPTYSIKAPNGQTYQIDGPEGATDEQVQAQVMAQHPDIAGTPAAAPAEAPAAPAPQLDAETFNAQLRGMIPDKAVSRKDIEAFAAANPDRQVQGLKEALDYRDRNPGYPGSVAIRDGDTRAKDAGQALADQTANGAGDFGTAFNAGVRRNLFGIPERLAAAGERFLPSAVTGNYSDASYDQILDTIRARTDAEMGKSVGGNILGSIVGGAAGGIGAAGTLAAGAGRLAASGAPTLARMGNYLETLATLKKGATASNAGKILLAGAGQGGLQGAGDGSGAVQGAALGAAGAAVLGTGFKAAQVITRPFRDVLRLSSADNILSRITKSTKEQLQTAADDYREATGAEPTLFQILPLADRNRILKSAVVGRDNVVEQFTTGVRNRSENLGQEMQDRAHDILDPNRNLQIGEIHRDMTAARQGNATPDDTALATNASQSPTDLLALRDEEARAIMAPHDNTPVVDNLNDLYPSEPGPDGSGQRISTDPEVQAVIRSAAGTLRQRPEDAGISASDVSDMISTLRGDLGKGGIEGRTAQRAIDHLENTLAENAPDAAAAHAQMTDAYAARSRMAEGMREGDQTRLRDDVQVGTNRKSARGVRNAYDTPEGEAGRALGQGNRILNDLGGSPEEALRATVNISRNSTGRQLSQNLGADEANGIMRAARAQDEAAQALASASQKAQGGGEGPGGIESLVQGLVGLHPGGFITTKLGAMQKLANIGVPENRARVIVDMVLSQNPDMVRRAINAVGDMPNGAQFSQYLAGVTGGLSAEAGNNAGPQPMDTAPPIPSATDPAAEQPASAEAAPEAVPIEAQDSQYAPDLQAVYDRESPELLALIDRVSGQESGGKQFGKDGKPTRSSAGAIGVMQVMPDTAPEAARLAGVPFDEDAYHNDAAYNKLIGIAYLSSLLRKYDGDVAKATAAYNAGHGRVDAAVRKDPAAWLNHVPAETQNYVQKVA